MTDAVNHPKHYTSHPSGVECIELARHMSFDLGNAFKYCWRAGLKTDRTEDLRKAQWYVSDWLNTSGSGVNPRQQRWDEYILSGCWSKVRESSDRDDPVFRVLEALYDAHCYQARDYVWRAFNMLTEILK